MTGESQQIVSVAGVDVYIEGEGNDTILMVHGWPDTFRLWDSPAQSLKDRYRCVRFTLPGFDFAHTKRAHSLDELTSTIKQIAGHVCPNQQVILMLHDWGCIFGYEFYMRNQQMVSRLIGVDVADGRSRHNRAELGIWGMFLVLTYQMWLAFAWRIGGRIGDSMSRGMARFLRCPTDPQSIGSQMGYPYAMAWLGTAGGFEGLQPIVPQCPMLYIYGERKPVMFHSRFWIEKLTAQPGSRVLGFRTGHWVMIEQPREFNDAVLSWLTETEKQTL